MGVTFFKLPKYSVFTYKPRYYDPEEEERQERIKQAKMEAGVVDEQTKEQKGQYRPNIKGQMRSRFERNKQKKKSSNIRLVIIFFVLLILAYLIIMY